MYMYILLVQLIITITNNYSLVLRKLGRQESETNWPRWGWFWSWCCWWSGENIHTDCCIGLSVQPETDDSRLPYTSQLMCDSQIPSAPHQSDLSTWCHIVHIYNHLVLHASDYLRNYYTKNCDFIFVTFSSDCFFVNMAQVFHKLCFYDLLGCICFVLFSWHFWRRWHTIITNEKTLLV